ncbi:MAG: hypothetical protein ACI3ZY_07665 [Parabacteroides sp.]
MESTYLIQATPTQVEWLAFATNQAMRIHIGQLTDPLTVLVNFMEAYQRHHEGRTCPSEVEERLEQLSRTCWHNTPNGYAYSEKARTLWEMYQKFKEKVGSTTAASFTLNRPQLATLRDALEQAARLRVGQTVTALLEELLSAYRRSHDKEPQAPNQIHLIRQQLSTELDLLHQCCWNMPASSSYGLGYDTQSDGCWSMYEVIRHAIWRENHPDRSAGDRLSVANDPPMRLGEEPLLRVWRR